MKINIGENLRRLRTQKEMTQEQLAAVLGVSPQAISRWENNSAYPDITVLPSIAIFYNTTIDELIGMDEICKTENINKIHHNVHLLMKENKIDETITMLKEALKFHPNAFLLDLASTLAQKSNQNNDMNLIEEAISLFERALQGNRSMKSKSTIVANLIFLYLKLNKADKAEELVKSLPHIWESREILIPELYNGDEYLNELKKSVVKALVLLCIKIQNSASRIYGEVPGYFQHGEFEPKDSNDEMLDLIKNFLQQPTFG
ncbi:MAG: helix-turn-helix transcriptional regulator [Saccharofermentanales bacterium]